jgi:DNA-binding response OmpR family regulator
MAQRILVVEDDPICQKVLVDFLSTWGYEVSAASNGVEGIDEAMRVKPALVLCDVLLPRKSGFEVCFELKRAPETRDVPVIFMSAVCNDAHARNHAAVDLRAQGYFEKPFSLGAVLARIQQLIGG